MPLMSAENAPVDHAAAAEFWSAYAAAHPDRATDTEPPSVEQFGDYPELTDELLDLVLHGPKRAPAGHVAEYVAEGQPLPRVGSHWIACDSTGDAVHRIFRFVLERSGAARYHPASD